MLRGGYISQGTSDEKSGTTKSHAAAFRRCPPLSAAVPRCPAYAADRCPQPSAPRLNRLSGALSRLLDDESFLPPNKLYFSLTNPPTLIWLGNEWVGWVGCGCIWRRVGWLCGGVGGGVGGGTEESLSSDNHRFIAVFLLLSREYLIGLTSILFLKWSSLLLYFTAAPSSSRTGRRRW